MQDRIHLLFIYYPIFLISLTIHEFCHGLVAHRRGDDTARLMGRLTLNPLPHLDPIGTVLFPIFSILFGGIYFAWAKPVPVNPLNFKNRRTDMFWVAAAGPFSNFLLAFFSAWIYGMTMSYGSRFMDEAMIRMIKDLTQVSIVLNLSLFFFNLIPVSPLDGSKIIGRFLPSGANQFFERINPMYGGIFLLLLLVSGLLKFLAVPIIGVGNALIRLFIF
ncbi:MAG: site-2 protease family protein [Deltaproteobacteria bacterium]